MRQLLLIFAIASLGPTLAAKPCVIGAAMSLYDSLRAQKAQMASACNRQVHISYAGSQIIARQIAAGAPYDVFLPASLAVLSKLPDGAARQTKPLLRNQLVLAGSKRSNTPSTISRIERLAIGAPGVPAGDYARDYLKASKHGLSPSTQRIFAEHVRGIVSLIERGLADAGFIYWTDYLKFKNTLRIIETIPDVKVSYPLAILSSNGCAKCLGEYLLSDARSATLFHEHGFTRSDE